MKNTIIVSILIASTLVIGCQKSSLLTDTQFREQGSILDLITQRTEGSLFIQASYFSNGNQTFYGVTGAVNETIGSLDRINAGDFLVDNLKITCQTVDQVSNVYYPEEGVSNSQDKLSTPYGKTNQRVDLVKNGSAIFSTTFDYIPTPIKTANSSVTISASTPITWEKDPNYSGSVCIVFTKETGDNDLKTVSYIADDSAELFNISNALQENPWLSGLVTVDLYRGAIKVPKGTDSKNYKVVFMSNTAIAAKIER